MIKHECPETEYILNNPLFFEGNRVSRVYTGGKLFGNFFGDDSEDGYFPEEWIASSVEALKGKDISKNNGLSKIKGTNILFKDLLEAQKEYMIGGKEELGVLVKILDSSIRLPVQCHPDKEFSKKHFNSRRCKYRPIHIQQGYKYRQGFGLWMAGRSGLDTHHQHRGDV